MMGNLVIDHNTFSFLEENNNRTSSLIKFVEAGNHARKNDDILHATMELYNSNYLWGNFFTDLIYKNYGQIKALEFWNWLPQTLHQSLATFFFQNPSGRYDFTDLEHFKETFKNEHFGSTGCDCNTITPDVFDLPSWHNWKICFYQANPQSYKWKPGDNAFLPNNPHSKTILEREVEKHNKKEKIDAVGLALAFHDHVMRAKGPELRAYAINIGTEIAEANYYTWEEELSDAEKKAWNSPRKIFSSLNAKGQKVYISIDHAHGMFEFHDHTGKHEGEYKFDGSYNSGPDASHNLRTI